jgi:hypothetical protein
MAKYQEHSETIEVPRGLGIAGLLHAIGKVLRLPRVQGVNIEVGSISFRRLIVEGEATTPTEVNFDTIAPSAIIRNVDLREVDASEEDPPEVSLVKLFKAAALHVLYPLVLVSGANTTFGKWCPRLADSSELVLGVEFLRDRQIPDDVLVLCAGYARDGGLLDTQRAYKMTMLPPLTKPQETRTDP